MNNATTYQDISSYGLLPNLRKRVQEMRANKIAPTRSTVYDSFHSDENDLTALQKLVLRTGKELLEAHERSIPEPAAT